MDGVAHVRAPGAFPEEFQARLGGFFRAHLGKPASSLIARS
jgi:hypothetical protein